MGSPPDHSPGRCRPSHPAAADRPDIAHQHGRVRAGCGGLPGPGRRLRRRARTRLNTRHPIGHPRNPRTPRRSHRRARRVQVAKAYPRHKLHVVLDNYGTHKHPTVGAWLARNPRITLHFTPTSGSWLNMVEIFFGIITRQALRRGSFTSVKDLTAAIRRFIDGYNDRCHPFTWTKTADDILDHCKPGQRTSFTRH